MLTSLRVFFTQRNTFQLRLRQRVFWIIFWTGSFRPLAGCNIVRIALGIPLGEGQKPLSQGASPRVRSGVARCLSYDLTPRQVHALPGMDPSQRGHAASLGKADSRTHQVVEGGNELSKSRLPDNCPRTL